MTDKQRAKLREAMAKATDLDGATMTWDAEGYAIEQAGKVAAYFPLDCEPMGEEDEAYNRQARFNAWLFLSCRDNLAELLADGDTLRESATTLDMGSIPVLDNPGWYLIRAEDLKHLRRLIGRSQEGNSV